MPWETPTGRASMAGAGSALLGVMDPNVVSLLVVVGGLAMLLSISRAWAAERVRVVGRLRARDWLAKFDEDGNLLSLSDGEMELVSRHHQLNNTPRLQFGEAVHICRRPRRMSTSASELVYDYRLNGSGWTVDVRYEIKLEGVGSRSIALIQQVSLRPQRPVNQDFAFILPQVLRLPVKDRRVFAPLKEGVGQEVSVDADNRSWAFYAAGSFVGQEVPLLAIPMIDEYAPEVGFRLTLCADPSFTTLFQVPVRPHAGAFQCVYKAQQVPLTGPQERTFYTILHPGGPDAALRVLYRTALEQIPAGPPWLHDIAMVGCDYLSDGGQGWFHDIDWLTERLETEDRARVCLLLHGWYDLVGRYTYDRRSRRLASEWIAFPEAPCWQEHLPRLRSVPMSRDQVKQRLSYARERGFRVLLHFADGLAVCEGAHDVYAPEKVLYRMDWHRPDAVGPVHVQNPLHPEVRQWYKDYLSGLLREYGRYLDGVVWDGTFQVDPNHVGPEHCPGYAAQAMMSLVRELAAIAHQHRKDCAFLTGDGIGLDGFQLKLPYGLVADGVLQDTGCDPQAWPFGVFPNYRNVLWSCNWHPVSRFEWTREGVERYGAPVAISNGWGEDMGISEMPEEVAQQILQLFHHRKQVRPRLQWLSAVDQPDRKAEQADTDEC